MELKDLQTADLHDEGADLRIRSPRDGKPTDLVIRIRGMDSKAWREQQRKNMQKLIEAKAAGKISEVDTFAMDVEMAVAVTIGWEGLQKEGKPYPFNPKNARALYSKSPPLVDQVQEFIAKRENFTGG